MLRLIFILHVITGVCDAVPPSQPQSVLADGWWLTWRAAPGEEDVNFTVYYHSFRSPTDEERWSVVPACNRTSSRRCDVTSTRAQAPHGCVKLRVQAERNGLTSPPEPACSVHGDSCTPEVRLSARPGSLTVHLTEDHGLFQEHAAHASHRIYFGQEGAPLQNHVTSSSSWTLHDLQVGQRYCTRVEFLLYNKSVGLGSCIQCLLIPEPASSVAVGAVVGVGVLLILVFPVTSYVVIFHGGKLKRCMKSPCQIPEGFMQRLQLVEPVLVFSPSEENFSVVSSFLPADESLRSPSLDGNCEEDWPRSFTKH